MTTTPPLSSSLGRIRRYPSARDAWVVAVIWGSSALCVWAGVETLFLTEPPITPIFALALLLAMAFMFWILYGTHYELGGWDLRARCGPFRMSVPVADIGSVVPTRNPLSSMALSLNRLAVRHRHGRLLVLISPREQETFLRHMCELDAEFEYVDGEVWRRSAGQESSRSTSPSKP